MTRSPGPRRRTPRRPSPRPSPGAQSQWVGEQRQLDVFPIGGWKVLKGDIVIRRCEKILCVFWILGWFLEGLG